MDIIITGDIKRPNPQKQNIEFLYHLIQYQVSSISKLQCIPISEGEDILGVYDWAKEFNSNNNYTTKTFSNSIIIGFELPPVFQRQLEKHNNKIINICVSPIRFMHDLNWTIETNFSVDLNKWFISEDQIKYEASLTSAAAIRLPSISCGEPAILIIGQTPSDRSVIQGSKIMTLNDFFPQLKELFSTHATVLFKPHPGASAGEGFLIENEIDYANVKDLNIYRLLTEPRVTTVVSLSSSVLEEAKYFNKKCVRFLETKSLQSIGTDTLISPLFWKDVLNPITTTHEAPNINLNASRDLSRKIVRSYWGMDFLR